MSSIFKRRVGATLGLTLSLKPADDSKFVRATLSDQSGAALSPPTQDLPNVGNGRYVDILRSMPSTTQVVADFEVYEDALYTQLSCEHLGDTDYFELDQSPLTATIIAGRLVAVLRAPRLSGILEREPDLIGKLANAQTTGLISSKKLKGTLSQRVLIGVIECGD